MKKQKLYYFAITLCLFVLCALPLSADNLELLNVNHDMPDTTLVYDENNALLQSVYIQYENVIKNLMQVQLENNIETLRTEMHKNLSVEFERKKNEEVALLEVSLRKELETKLREELSVEFEQKKNEELALLETSLRKKVETKLREELSVEYEQKKNEELALLEVSLRKELESKLREELSVEYEQKKNEELALLEVSLKKELETKLREEFSVEYEKKKNEELALLETSLKKELETKSREELSVEFEQKKNEELALLEAKLREEVEPKLREELSIEYEQKKNEELALLEVKLREELKKELKKEVSNQYFVESGRLFYSIILLLLVIVIIVVILVINKIKYFAKKYFTKLQNDNPLHPITEKEEEISKEINSSSLIQKLMKQKAFEKAKTNIQINKYEEKIDACFKNLKDKFRDWSNNPSETMDFYIPITNFFEETLQELISHASSAITKLNNKKEVKKMLKRYVPELKSISLRMSELLNNSTDNDLQNKINSLSKNAKNCAKKFAKGAF